MKEGGSKMGLLTEKASSEKLEELKAKRAAVATELELRQAIANEERLLEAEEKKLNDLKTAKWIKGIIK
jgi:hypothetical protein